MNDIMRCNHVTMSFKTLIGTYKTRLPGYASCDSRQHFHTVHENRHTWSVLKHIYQRQMRTAKKKYACLLLNMVNESREAFDHNRFIWDDAHLRIAVDGSANFLAKQNQLHSAHIISGDFDSIDARLIHRLQSPKKAPRSPPYEGQLHDGSPNPVATDNLQRSPQIVETPNQKETDFTKAIHVSTEFRPDIQTFFALYYSDGQRLDHLFGIINTLHLIKKTIFIFNTKSNTVSWLLQPGDHTILKPQGQELCSLVPFIGPTEVKTQGLLYNVNKKSPMSFGGLISTSNFCQPGRHKINVDTKGEILWSLDLYKTEAQRI